MKILSFSMKILDFLYENLTDFLYNFFNDSYKLLLQS